MRLDEVFPSPESKLRGQGRRRGRPPPALSVGGSVQALPDKLVQLRRYWGPVLEIRKSKFRWAAALKLLVGFDGHGKDHRVRCCLVILYLAMTAMPSRRKDQESDGHA